MNRVLGGLGFHLLPAHSGDQGDVDVKDVLAAEVVLELADGLQEGKGLDVADGAADLDHHHLGLRLAGRADDTLLDLVGHVGDDLHGGAQVVAAPLLGDDLAVDLAGGHVGGGREVGVGEALVVAEIEVGLGAVVGDEDLAVLVGAHGARVDVEVRVQLLEGDGKAAGLQDVPDRGRCDAFAERADDTAGHEDVLGQHWTPCGFCNPTGPQPAANLDFRPPRRGQ